MFWGVVTLIGIFIMPLWAAISIARRKTVILGMICGFPVGVVGWLAATFSFYFA
jgi:hypothetical protein